MGVTTPWLTNTPQKRITEEIGLNAQVPRQQPLSGEADTEPPWGYRGTGWRGASTCGEDRKSGPRRDKPPPTPARAFPVGGRARRPKGKSCGPRSRGAEGPAAVHRPRTKGQGATASGVPEGRAKTQIPGGPSHLLRLQPLGFQKKGVDVRRGPSGEEITLISRPQPSPPSAAGGRQQQLTFRESEVGASRCGPVSSRPGPAPAPPPAFPHRPPPGPQAPPSGPARPAGSTSWPRPPPQTPRCSLRSRSGPPDSCSPQSRSRPQVRPLPQGWSHAARTPSHSTLLPQPPLRPWPRDSELRGPGARLSDPAPPGATSGRRASAKWRRGVGFPVGFPLSELSIL
ncbi:proline-rich protein HaeIII subfamily 1-like [Ochotona curzoniae]|uniref:proline-rich protein HaeIII subfamily 1-like n=1 Tax=Ochotona curzoniae TaxID=130825 RepID=UPI001B34D93A|nr:proline-rich protein HaeIII subfamily 1-like [Ochotona curzoniae]